jgi:hypothetical protein
MGSREKAAAFRGPARVPSAAAVPPKAVPVKIWRRVNIMLLPTREGKTGSRIGF